MLKSYCAVLMLLAAVGCVGAAERDEARIKGCYRGFLLGIKRNDRARAREALLPLEGKAASDAVLLVDMLVAPRRLTAAAKAAFGSAPDDWTTGVISDAQIEKALAGLPEAKVSRKGTAATLHVADSPGLPEVLTHDIPFKRVDAGWRIDPISWGAFDPENENTTSWVPGIRRSIVIAEQVTQEIRDGKVRSRDDAERRLKALTRRGEAGK